MVEIPCTGNAISPAGAVRPRQPRLRCGMEIADWRRKIDEVDQKIVHLLNERAKAVQHIGALKDAAELPVYEP